MADPLDIQMLRDTFVRPFYLRLLHGNFTRPAEVESEITRTVITAARTISDEQLETLLNERDWRGRLCAAWFVGLTRRASFIPLIGTRLLASEMVYSGEGYCTALALLGTEECTQLLHLYLKTYLPLNGRVYNQDWAIGALAHIQGDPPQEFLERELWQDGQYTMDPIEGIETFNEIVAYLRRFQMLSSQR